jgi:2-polyprenyl-6-methoxyphenol hydroxylase-like FAD-dependent oxidoreductase
MKPDVDVLVVGAGPVGLTLAIALRRLSLSVRVVDKAPGTNREPKADVLFPRAGEALGAIGAGEAIRKHSYEMQGANFYGSGRHLGSFRVGRLQTQYARAMTIEQHEIEALLADELTQRAVEVEWNTTLQDLRATDDYVAVSLTLQDGRTDVVTAAWVVGCDGLRSTVRDRLGIAFEGERRRNMQVVQGNVEPTWHLENKPGHGYFFLAPYRSVIAFPTPAAGYRIFCVRDDPHPDRTQPPTLAELRDLVAEAADIPDLQLTLTDPIWLSRARFADRVAATLRRGRVLLAGDAAHAWAPIGGHGMNVGMIGAHNLAWKLAAVHRGQAVDAVLDTYSIEQRELALGVIRDMRMNIMEMLLPPLIHRVRSAFLRMALPRQGFQRRSEFMMSDFGRNHRRSPLSWQRTRRLRRGVRAGDRLPDIAVIPTVVPSPGPAGERPSARADGRTVNLHNLLSYHRWTLLIAAARADTGTVDALRAACTAGAVDVEVVPIAIPDADDARQLGRSGEMTLVRPDAHVALIAPVDRPNLIRQYLATFAPARGRAGQPDGPQHVPPAAATA